MNIIICVKPECSSIIESFPESEIGKENVLLQHIADVSSPTFAEAVPVESHPTCIRSSPASKHVQQSRLATA